MPIWNPFNPLGAIKDGLLDLYEKMILIFQLIVTNPPRVSDAGGLTGFYSTSLNLAEYLAYLVLVVAVVSAAMFRKKMRPLKAFVVFFAIAVGSPLWLWTVDQMISTGNALSAAMNFYEGNGDSTIVLPVIDNVFGYIAGLSLTLMSGSVLTAFLMSYDFLVIAFKFWGPIAFSVSSLGKRSLQFSNMVLSLGLVATLLGRPFAVFFMEMGQLGVATFPLGQTAYGATVYSVGSFGLAGASQLVLVAACYVGIKQVEGFVGAKLGSGIESTIKNVAKVDVRKTSSNRSNALKPMPVTIVNGPQQSRIRSGARTARNSAIRKASTIAAGATTAAGHPWLGAGIKTFGGQFRDNKKGNR